MWQGLKTITDYKGKPSRELPSASNTEACMRAPAVLDDCDKAIGSKILKQVNIHKAVGPDGLPGRELKARAAQLIFSNSP
jgi:hypothetical protein